MRRQPLFLTLILSKWRERGLRWVINAGVGVGWRLLPDTIKVGWANIRDWALVTPKREANVLYAFYDLSVHGISYDCVGFLVLAELERQQRRLKSVHVVIVPGRNNTFRSQPSEQNKLAQDNLLWRLRNVVIPCCWLLPHCSGITICSTRAEAIALQRRVVVHVFPHGYTDSFSPKRDSIIRLVQAHHQGFAPTVFEASPAARFFLEQWLRTYARGRKPITITLRESTYSLARNSNIAAWAQFIKSLDKAKFCPVIVRDTERAFDHPLAALTGVSIFTDVSWNLDLRMALYELSYLNLMVNNGPGALLFASRRTRYLYFKILTAPYRSTSAEFYQKKVGLQPGESFPWATPFQKYVWEDDTYDVIKREFEAMARLIDAAE